MGAMVEIPPADCLECECVRDEVWKCRRISRATVSPQLPERIETKEVFVDCPFSARNALRRSVRLGATTNFCEARYW